MREMKITDINSAGEWCGEGPDPRGLRDVLITEVIEEIVNLAGKHTDAKVEYRIFPLSYYENQRLGFNKEPMDDRYGSIWCKSTKNLDVFWAEFERLSAIVTKPLNEPVLEDDHPVHQGYLYVADGKVREFIDGMNMTVGCWKALRLDGVAPVHEVRRCDIAGRQQRLPLKKEPVKKSWFTNNGKSLSANQKHRRPRSSNKIKKVK